MDGQQLYKALVLPFPPEEIEWKLQNVLNKESGRAQVVPYVKCAAIQRRLDETVNPYNWQTDFAPWITLRDRPSQLCTLSIYIESRGEWVHKTDGADLTEYEPIKGGISGAFKRAAQQWGIGRYLKKFPVQYMDAQPYENNKWRLPKESYQQLEEIYARWLETARTGAPVPASKEPSSVSDGGFSHEYLVKTVAPESFGQSLLLLDRQGRSFTAIKKGKDGGLAEGVCLCEVKLSEYPGRPDLMCLDRYRIAA